MIFSLIFCAGLLKSRCLLGWVIGGLEFEDSWFEGLRLCHLWHEPLDSKGPGQYSFLSRAFLCLRSRVALDLRMMESV